MSSSVRRVVLSGPAELRSCLNAALARAVVSLPIAASSNDDDVVHLVLCIEAMPDGVEVLGESAGTAGVGRRPMRLAPQDDFGIGELLAALSKLDALVAQTDATSNAACAPTEPPPPRRLGVPTLIEGRGQATTRRAPRADSEAPASEPSPMMTPPTLPPRAAFEHRDPAPRIEDLASAPVATSSDPPIALESPVSGENVAPREAEEHRLEQVGEIAEDDEQPPPSAIMVAAAAGVPPINDPRAQFPAFLVALSAAVRRTGYYSQEHPEFRSSVGNVFEAASVSLHGRNEISITRASGVSEGGSDSLLVQTGLGESQPLGVLLAAGQHDHAVALAEVFARKHLLLLTLKTGIAEHELGELLGLLSGTERPLSEIRDTLNAMTLPHVSVLFHPDLVGSDRGLPWQVELCISRMVRDFRLVPALRDAGASRLRHVRTQLLGDIVRPLSSTEMLLALLRNADIIEHEISKISELAALDIVASIIEAISIRRAVQLGQALLTATGGDDDSAGARRVNSARELITTRAIDERGAEADDLLCALHRNGQLSRARLPDALLVTVDGDALAAALVALHQNVSETLSAAVAQHPARHAGAVVEHAIDALITTEEVRPLARLALRLKELADASNPSDLEAAIAACGLRKLEQDTCLRAVVHLLLVGNHEAREAGRDIVLVVGRAAGRTLCSERKALGGKVAGRGRFVSTLRELGEACVPPILQALSELETDDSEVGAASAQDFLRALPDAPNTTAGARVERFLLHPNEGVRSAATRAIGPLWGDLARPALLRLLQGESEQLRIDAIFGLVRIGGVDAQAVLLLSRIVRLSDPSQVDLLAAATAALAAARPECVAEARQTLRHLFEAPRSSFMSFLKSAQTPRKLYGVALDAAVSALLRLDGESGRELINAAVARAPEELALDLRAAVERAARPVSG